jgi:hypothetical protein
VPITSPVRPTCTITPSNFVLMPRS